MYSIIFIAPWNISNWKTRNKKSFENKFFILANNDKNTIKTKKTGSKSEVLTKCK